MRAALLGLVIVAIMTVIMVCLFLNAGRFDDAGAIGAIGLMFSLTFGIVAAASDDGDELP